MKYQHVLNKIESVEEYMNEHKGYINTASMVGYNHKLNELRILSYIREIESILEEVDKLINNERYTEARENLDNAYNHLKIAERMAGEFKIGTFSEKFINLRNEITSRNNSIIKRLLGDGPIEGFPIELNKKYKALEELGTTQLSKVFKVERSRDNKIIVIKIPKEGEEYLIKREYEILKKLSHQYIIKTYGYYEEPIPHIELEYVEGYKLDGKLIESLKDYPKPMDEKESVELIIKIAEGLAYAHSMKIIHKDIKPSNILLTPDLNPKIIDFNISKSGDKTTTVKGFTKEYSSPEQIKGEKTDERSDIYSLGVVFYELLTGRLPDKYNPKPPSQINPKLIKYNNIFFKLLAPDRKDRYQSMDEFLKEIKPFINWDGHTKTINKKNSNNWHTKHV